MALPNLPLHLLQSFVTFNESKNILEAARKLGLSQPGLSKQLSQLERALPGEGEHLAGRKKTLTPFGRELHRRVKEKIGSLQSEAQAAWALHSRPEQARVRLLARRGVLDRLSNKLKFRGSIFFQEAANEKILQSLLNLEAEIGVTHTAPSSHELIAKPIFREEFQLVIPRKWMSSRPTLNQDLIRKLSTLPCLSFKAEDELLRGLFASAEVRDFRLARTTENYQSLSQMVEAELGWAILPSYFSVPRSTAWCLPIPSKTLPSRQFYLLYRREFASLGWFQDLLAEIRDCFGTRAP